MAKTKSNSGLIIGIFLAIALLVGGFYFIQQSAVGSPEHPSPTTCADSTGVLTVNAVDAEQQSSTISTPTITAGVNGGPITTTVTSGTTTFAVGDSITVLVSKAGYIDKSFSFVMPCGGEVLEAPLYAASATNPTVRIKNDDGDFMTDNVAGGATNQTDLSTGETLNLDVEFQGVALENSGDLIYVVELPANSAANVTSITMPGLKSVPIPTTHTLQNAGSKAAAFEVPAIDNGAKKTYTLSIVLGASKDLSGGVYTDWYAEQEFTDLDGSIQYGVENSQGTAEFENSGDSDFYINSA